MSYFRGRNLKPGIHELTWDEFEQMYSIDEVRIEFIARMKELIKMLKEAGCKKIYINGSFITKKKRPGDYDLLWEDGDHIDYDKLDPIIRYPWNHEEGRKKKFKGDIYPAGIIASQVPSQTFLEFFQKTRDGREKGIIMIKI